MTPESSGPLRSVDLAPTDEAGLVTDDNPQTPHDTVSPGETVWTRHSEQTSVRRNGHDGDAGRSAASLAETAAPNVTEHESPQEVTFWEALGEGAEFDADAYDHEGEL